MKRLQFTFSVLFILLASTLIQWGGISIVKASPDIHQGDLVLQGNNVTIIEGLFDINGSIIVEENASLILRNAVLNITHPGGITLKNPVNGNPRLRVEDTIIVKAHYNRFYGDSSVIFSNCSASGHYYLDDEVNATIRDSTINYLQARESSEASISNSTIEQLSIVPFSTNVSVTNLSPGFLASWDFWLNCSVQMNPSGKAPYLSLMQTTINTWDFSFQSFEASYQDIINSSVGLLHSNGLSHISVHNSTIDKIELYSSSVVRLINSTYSTHKLLDNTTIITSWYLDINVIDSIGQNIPYAKIVASYPNATLAMTTLTDMDGNARLVLTQKIVNATDETYIGNYTIEANYWAFSNTTTVNMTENLAITRTLDGFELPSAIYIKADGAVEPVEAPIQQDGSLYSLRDDIHLPIVVEKDNIQVDGEGHAIRGLRGHAAGVDLSNRKNVTVTNIQFRARMGLCILLNNSAGNTVSENNMTNVGGLWILNSVNNTVIGNFIYGSEGAIWLNASLGNSIQGNNITFNIIGVELAYSSDNSILSNYLSGSLYYGIMLHRDSHHNVISGNMITDNAGGIRLQGTNNSHIAGNSIVRNDELGINLLVASHNTVVENSIMDNDYGIYLEGGLNNTLNANSFAHNNYTVTFEGSINNTLLSNSLIANRIYGVWLSWSSNNNLFVHNNFVDSGKHVHISSSSFVNFWDNGFEGNYWDNYTSVDSRHIGIGDSWHMLDENNTDQHPLMGMFHSFNTSPGYYVNVVSNSTISDFEYFDSNGTITMYVSNSSATQSFGFCRICIPKDLMSQVTLVIINDGLTEFLHFNNTVYANETHTWTYFAYQHSTHKVDIIPEFPSLVILTLFMTATLLAVIVYRRKQLPEHR